MLKIFKMAIPSKAILAPTIQYIGAFTSLRWNRRQRSAEIGSGCGGQRSESEAEADVDVRVSINIIKISGSSV